MKKIVAAAMVVSALILVALPTSDAIHCGKQFSCESKKTYVIDPDSANGTIVECPGKCAAWACNKGNVLYSGMDCEGDNACKDVDNAISTTCDVEFPDLPCNLALLLLNKGSFSVKNPSLIVKEDLADLDKCTPSKDGSKVGVMAIGGMVLLAWMFAQ